MPQPLIDYLNSQNDFQGYSPVAAPPVPPTPPPQPIVQVPGTPAQLGAPVLQQPSVTPPDNYAPPYMPQPGPDSLTATPKEATGGVLNTLASDQGAAEQIGDINAEGAQKRFDVGMEDVNRTTNQAWNELANADPAVNNSAASHAAALQKAMEQHAEDTWKSDVALGQDPSDVYWEKKGTANRLVSAFVGGLTGFGAGFTKTANPFMDILNNSINQDYDARLQSNKEMHQSLVDEGKISDNLRNQQEFERTTRYAAYNLQSTATQKKLQAISDQTSSQVVKMAAQQQINEIERAKIAVQQNFAQVQAQANMYDLNQVRAAYKKAEDSADKLGLVGDQRRAHILQELGDTPGLLHNPRSYGLISPLAEGAGGTFNADPKKGATGLVLPDPDHPGSFMPFKASASFGNAASGSGVTVDETTGQVKTATINPQTGKAYDVKEIDERVKPAKELAGQLAQVNNVIGEMTAAQQTGHPSKYTAGGVMGNTLNATLPAALVPGAAKAVNDRESLNNNTLVSIGAAYKLGTSATEPKNRGYLEELAGPFLIKPGDTDTQALQKMHNLHDFLVTQAGSQGVSLVNPKNGKAAVTAPIKTTASQLPPIAK